MRKVITVLKALELGIPVRIKELKQDIFLSEDNDICMKFLENRYTNLGMGFKLLVSLCNKMSDDEIFILNANIALNKIKKL